MEYQEQQHHHLILLDVLNINERIEPILPPFLMYYVNADHGTDESTIDEPFHAEDVPLIEPREFLVMGWSAIETSRIEKNV
ncbi:MAG: hypothetical protein EZS28_032817 [Streblomastix strix]|uniref:Uncharacterized protein n=1 Tax=Streblomastix strix TaxID=222440 RepID=A0A5J4UNU8_9EUKA|nr:MAG: hypothetical protein EZS28_032817 [Streblomastix strix]